MQDKQDKYYIDMAEVFASLADLPDLEDFSYKSGLPYDDVFYFIQCEGLVDDTSFLDGRAGNITAALIATARHLVNVANVLTEFAVYNAAKRQRDDVIDLRDRVQNLLGLMSEKPL